MITIVTPSYNQGNYLEKTIFSVWRQKGKVEIEHIIADGGSTDNSLEIIKKYDRLYQQKRFPFACSRFCFSYWSRKDKGQFEAINKGLMRAKGEIVSWLNSDDLLASPWALERVQKAFQNNSQADIVVGNLRIIDERGRSLTEPPIFCNDMNNQEFTRYLPAILDHCFIPQPATFFKKTIYQQYKINNYHYGMDWDLWIRCYLDKKIFLKIKQPIASFRIQQNGKTTVGGTRYYAENLVILKKYNPHSKQILINQLLLWKSYQEQNPLWGRAVNQIFNSLLKLYLNFKFKIIKKKTPLFA
jgi:glycosyltransferase involved in cell wall biosynthesis